MDEILARTTSLLKNAYAPYSGRAAAAALITADGRAWYGVTCENAAFTDGFEGVETALGVMMIGSHWAESGVLPVITDAVIVNASSAPTGDGLPGPVALARLRQFCGPDVMLHIATPEAGITARHRIGDLMAYAAALRFDPAVLEEKKKMWAWLRKTEAEATDPSLRRLQEAMADAYCPVSGYSVAARVTVSSGAHFYGCNIELGANISMHAEAMAIAAMVTALGPGGRIANVATLVRGDPAYPCGDCRQKMGEFRLPDTDFTAFSLKGGSHNVTFAELLPYCFGAAQLESAHKETLSA